MPLRREDKGTYTVTIVREKQWFAINPALKVIVDSMDVYNIEKNGSLSISLTAGSHVLEVSLPLKKKIVSFDLKEDLVIHTKSNRMTGELEIKGYGIAVKDCGAKFSVGVGIGTKL